MPVHQKPRLLIQTTDSVELDPNSEFSQQVYAQTDSYSITPTTFQKRTFFGAGTEFDIKKLVQHERTKVAEEVAKVSKSETVGETLQSLLKQIKDAPSDFYSLSTVADTLLTIVNEQFTSKPLKSYLAELEKFQEFLSRIELLTFEDLYKYGDDEVSRFGINTAIIDPKQSAALASIYTPATVKQASEKSKKSSTSSKNLESIKILTPLEVLLLRKAIKYLETNQTVLVDIFDKDDHGRIKLDEQQKPKIHTVVLYKNLADESQIFVIDPSNSTFSKHLSVNSLRLFGAIIPDIKIKTSSTELKIYSPSEGASVGPEPHQYRDCIDIAVKIAFGLNHESITDLQNITSSKAICSVTNQQRIMDSLFFAPEKAVARIRQSSDPNIRGKTHKLLMEADRQIKGLSEHFPTTDLSVSRKKYIETFDSPHTYAQYSEQCKKLYNVYKEGAEFFKEEIDNKLKDLLGITPDLEGN